MGALSFAPAPDRLQVSGFNVQIDQLAGTYDLCTATGGIIAIDRIDFHVGHTGLGFTSVSIQTNDGEARVLLNATAGAIANILAGHNLVSYTTPFVLSTTKKIQYTIIGNGTQGDIGAVIHYKAVPRNIGGIGTLV